MSVAIKQFEYLPVPDDIMQKLRGKKIEFTEVPEGILIKMISDEDGVEGLLGFARKCKFSTERYAEQKKLIRN